MKWNEIETKYKFVSKNYTLIYFKYGNNEIKEI